MTPPETLPGAPPGGRPPRPPPPAAGAPPPRIPKFCSEEKPRCVCGARLHPAHRPSTDGTLTCTHKPAREAAACGKLLFVALFSFGGSAVVRGAGERLWLVLEITPEELRHLQRVPMTFLEKMLYLRCTLPGVDLDLLGGIADG